LARLWPALDVWNVEADLLLAVVDDFGPTAVEEHDDTVRLFFSTTTARDEAGRAIVSNPIVGTPRQQLVDVSDDDWARRSQDNLQPVTVGKITVLPDSRLLGPDPAALAIVIPPSMAFGTGHHATTRLCLAALQTVPLADASVVDVGTGSGILAITAVALGATRALGIDYDVDAIAAARENVERNRHIPGIERVALECLDLGSLAEQTADCVTANLTGTLIAAQAGTLQSAVRPGGRLILSGVLADEWAAVFAAFGGAVKKVWQSQEDGWIGAVVVKK